MPCDLFIAAQNVHHLGAGEQAVGDLGVGAGRDGARRKAVIGLIGLDVAGHGGAQIGAVIGFALGRDDRRHPIFVGDAHPAAGGGEGLGRRACILEVAIFGVHLAAIGDTDKTLMQHPGGRAPWARLRAPHRQRDKASRPAGIVGDAVGDAEHVFVVDGDDAGEERAMAIVPGQCHRMAGRQRARALLLPDALVVGHGCCADPAEFGVIRIVGALGREQHDLRALGVGGLAIFLQAQIVELGALELDRAVQHRGVNRHALAARFQRGVARHMVGAAPCPARRGRPARQSRDGFFLMRQHGLTRLLGLHLRRGDEILPAEQHQRRQRDGEKIFLLMPFMRFFMLSV